MSDAFIGLIGALLGGALTSGTTLLNDWRRDKAARKASETAAEEAMRTARRLVSDELTRNIDLYLEHHFKGVAASAPNDEIWRKFRDQLAIGLTDDEWNAVTEAYRYLDHLFISDDAYRAAVTLVDDAVRALWPSGAPRREIPEPPEEMAN